MLKKSLLIIIIGVAIISFLFYGSFVNAQEKANHYLNFKNSGELQQFFRYKGDETIIVSGHRGGRERNFPENSIEVMEDVLSQMPAFFELDPRLTKDSIIVLMHDVTLNRTTDGTGKLSDYTYAELSQIRLKDSEGNITPFQIPTLEEVIIWSKGRTVINLDKKDVPLWMITDLLKKHKAENHCNADSSLQVPRQDITTTVSPVSCYQFLHVIIKNMRILQFQEFPGEI